MASHSRNIRVDDDLWERAKAYAAERGTTVTGLVIGYLEHLDDLVGSINTSGPAPKGILTTDRDTGQKTLHPVGDEVMRRVASSVSRQHAADCKCYGCKPPKAEK